MATQSGHWMDRLRTAETGHPAWLDTPAPSRGSPEPIDVTNARNALRYRRSLMRDASQPLLKPRGKGALNIQIPKRIAFAVITACLGVALSYAGSANSSQLLLLAGFCCALAGVLAGCIALSTLLERGSTRHSAVQGASTLLTPASRDQVAAMKRAARADPELGILINGWWKNPAPISLHDVALVLAFQKARAIAARADSTLH